jgi:hypothetical protein
MCKRKEKKPLDDGENLIREPPGLMEGAMVMEREGGEGGRGRERDQLAVRH